MVRIKIGFYEYDVAGFDGHIGTGANRDADICGHERGRVISRCRQPWRRGGHQAFSSRSLRLSDRQYFREHRIDTTLAAYR
jgi:hypothetical protein